MKTGYKPYTRNYDRMPKSKRGVECFYAMLVAGGIFLTLDNGQLVIHAPGDNVSPVLRSEIAKREQALIAHVRGLG